MLSIPIGLSHTIYQEIQNPIELTNRIKGYEHYAITKCSCKSIFLFNGILSGLGSLISLPISGMLIEHQWAIIEARSETDESIEKIYLLAQSFKNTLALIPFESEEKSDAVAMESAARDGDNTPLTFDIFEPSERVTVEELYEFMKSRNREYNWLVNNCQHFVQEFCEKYSPFGYQRIREEEGSNSAMVHERSSLLPSMDRGRIFGSMNPDEADPWPDDQNSRQGSIIIPCTIQ